jgi:hypothetical protein
MATHTQTGEEKEAVMAEWETNYMPKDLSKDNFNALLIADEIRTAFLGYVSITNLNACVSRLSDKLHRVVTAPPAPEPFVLRNPDTLAPITNREELMAFVGAAPNNMRHLMYDSRGKKSVEAEKEVNRLLNSASASTPNSEKAARKKQREEADRWGIRTYGSDKSELDRKTLAKTRDDSVERRNKEAFAQAQAARVVEDRIQNFLISSASGKVDWANTHRQREVLRAIKFEKPDGTPDHVRTANTVGQKIRELAR